jgi:Cu/Ag efflux pump CusA
MIEKIVEYSIRNPLVVILAAAALAGWGIYATYNTPVDAIPDLSENQVIVFADWPGRSPREVEDQVTYPLSVNLQGLAGIKSIRAMSEFGFSMLSIIFEDNVEFYFARQRVLERLSLAGTFLPQDVVPYLAPDSTALGQIFWYTVEGEGRDLGELRAVQDWFVRYQLYSVPGVAEVASVGGMPKEYQIDVDPNKLRAFGVTLGELYSAVARSNSSVGGRVIQKANSEYLVRSIGWIKSLADVEKIVIKSVGGTPVQVRDVAAVQFGTAQRRGVLEKNGNEAVGGVVLMRFGENPLAVTERIKEKIEQLQAGLPEGVRIVPFYDRTRLIHDAIGTISEALTQEIIVASLAIILIMWHFRSALIICLMLPLAVLVSFILMRYLGISSNIMSLCGIAISIGVLVDAAIVMVDQGAHTLHQRFGRQRVRGDTRDLLIPALKTVGRPIFFSLAIMIVSFIPVFALGGLNGRMFHPLAYTKTFALVGVSVLAITLVPALIPWLVRGRIRAESDNWAVRQVIAIYRPVLNFVMDHPWPVVWLISAVYLLGALPFGVWWLFYLSLIFALAANIWAAWREERAFRRHWPWAWMAWAATLCIALAVIGWRPSDVTWLPQGVLWLAAAAGVAIMTLLIVRLLTFARVSAAGTLVGTLLIVALTGAQVMKPLGRENMPTLNEGTFLEMPVTLPRASVTQVADDMKARDAMLRVFPEIELIVGKAGRAETPSDPAPLDMLESVVNLRRREHWPRRRLAESDALDQTRRVHAALLEAAAIADTDDHSKVDQLIRDATTSARERFDVSMREAAFPQVKTFERELAPRLTTFAVNEAIDLLRDAGKLDWQVDDAARLSMAEKLAPQFGPQLVSSPDKTVVGRLTQAIADELIKNAYATSTPDLLTLEPGLVGRLARGIGEVLGQKRPTFSSVLLERIEAERDRRWVDFVGQLDWRLYDLAASIYTEHAARQLIQKAKDAGLARDEPTPEQLKDLLGAAAAQFNGQFMLWRKSQPELKQELELVHLPGWTDIWTEPIINRINMLSTGVSTELGVRVFGNDLRQIQKVAEKVEAVIKQVPGVAAVSADRLETEGYLEIEIDRDRAARYGINVGDVQDVVESALGGKTITTTVEGRERFPVRIRYARSFRVDEESVKNLLVSAAGGTPPLQVPLSQVADVRIVSGPKNIQTENGLLRSYVRVTLGDRDILGFVEEAQRAVNAQVPLPSGMYLEWTGQFVHELETRHTLFLILPLVIVTIFVILYLTYHDLADTLIVMLLAVPGAIFGGVLLQYAFGYDFSVAVWVGFIACFGLAVEGGLVILVYLREAIEQRGGLENMTLAELRQAVMDGAVHRTRPKLLTELTTMVGLVPMLWATGTGSEMIKPMAVPVLGGILVADEVIDLLLPGLFYRVRVGRWRRLHGGAKFDAARIWRRLTRWRGRVPRRRGRPIAAQAT